MPATNDQAPLAKEKLKNFIRDVYSIIGAIAERGEDVRGSSLFSENYKQLLHTAWQEYQRDFPIATLTAQIDNLTPDQLTTAGLYGSQLELKLSIFEKWKMEYRSIGGSMVLRKLFEIINKILGSFAHVGIAEALMELKEALESLLPLEVGRMRSWFRR